MDHVVGIDASLKRTAVFVLDQHGNFVNRRCFESPHTNQVGPMGRVYRNQIVGKNVREFLIPRQPVCIVFEGYTFGSKSAYHNDIVEHGYELRAMLCHKQMTRLQKMIEVPPPCLKKHCTGRGKAEKAAMVAKMVKRFPDLEFEFDDEADAAALALFGLQAMGFAEPANDFQRDSFTKICGEWRSAEELAPVAEEAPY